MVDVSECSLLYSSVKIREVQEVYSTANLSVYFPTIYTIILIKSVCLSVCRCSQFLLDRLERYLKLFV